MTGDMLEQLDATFGSLSLQGLAGDYDAIARAFYAPFPEWARQTFAEDAIYHRDRYLDMLGRVYTGGVLEVGSDKPFISYFLRRLHPKAQFTTISMDMPPSPLPVTQVDIEFEVFPFSDASFRQAIFTEVLEHLWRDPAWAMWQINRVLEPGGELFLTTPNACAADVAQAVLLQSNPNPRSQYFLRLEAGHLHLWTMRELELVLGAHGFAVEEMTSANFVEGMEVAEDLLALLRERAPADRFGQTIRCVAVKRSEVEKPVYPRVIFPREAPVQMTGALEKWARAKLRERD